MNLRELFRNHQDEIWHQLAEKIGAAFVEGDFCHPDKVIAHIDEWTVTLDTYTVPVGRVPVTYTRFRAPYVNADGLQFTVYRRDLFSDLAKHFGMQDIEIGDAELDAAYIFQGNNPEKVRALFAAPRLRELLRKQHEFHIQIQDDEGWFGVHFPEGVDELVYHAAGVITDIETLLSLYEIFAETLHGLCHIGSAYHDDPHLALNQ